MIITERVDPPIPTTMYDWMAYDDQGDETMNGRGPTEAAALRDLCEQLATKWCDAETAAADFKREILAVRRYCGNVMDEGTANERAVAQTVSRMLARQPTA